MEERQIIQQIPPLPESVMGGSAAQRAHTHTQRFVVKASPENHSFIPVKPANET